MSRLIDADKMSKDINDVIKHVIPQSEYTKGYVDGLGAAGKYLSEQPTIEQPKWIPVTMRLPDEHVDVQMCWKASGTQATGFYMDESWYTYGEDGYYTDCEKAPTHWKPTEEPPKGDE